MPDGRRRSREHWTDTMEAPPPNPPAHVHRLPKVVRLALVGLTLAVFLALVGIGLMAGAVYQANQYVQGRGEYRDREAARMERETDESLRRAICDLLDQLPEGGLLDRPRGKYDCGPGIPLAQLTPDERAQLSAPRSQVVTPAEPTSEAAAPTTPGPIREGAAGPMAAPSAPAPAPSRPVPPSAARPATTAPTSPPARPLTNPLCDVLSSVLKETPCSSD